MRKEAIKGQAVLEFIMTYSWAILIILIVISVLGFVFSSNLNSSIFNINSIKSAVSGKSVFNLNTIKNTISGKATFSSLSEGSSSNTGWYSWGKDSANSRIADDSISPPFKIEWRQTIPVNNRYFSILSRLFYQNGRVFTTLTSRGGHYTFGDDTCVAAFNSTTGDYLWRYVCGGVDGWTGFGAFVNGTVFGGNDHAGTWAVSQETGQLEDATGSISGFNQANENGTEVYAYGTPCIDCSEVDLFALNVSREPLVSPVSNGKINGAFRFPDPRGYYRVGQDHMNLGSILSPGSRNWTFMLWFNWSASPSPNTLFLKTGTGGYYSYPVNVYILNGQLYYHLQPEWGVFGNFSVTPGEWTHLALTFDHRLVKLYKDGQLVFKRVAYHQIQNPYTYTTEQLKSDLLARASGQSDLIAFINSLPVANYSASQDFLNALLANGISSYSDTTDFENRMLSDVSYLETDIGDSNDNFYLGGDGGRGAGDFNGEMDEFAVFDRALSSGEIASSYNNQISPDSSTQLLYHFDNNPSYGENGTFVYDFSGKGNNYNFDNHLTTSLIWGAAMGGAGVGVPAMWYGGYAGFGMPAEHSGILYVPWGILYAFNTTNGNIIWQNGQYPSLVKTGDIVHFSAATYSGGILYSIGEQALSEFTCTSGCGDYGSCVPLCPDFIPANVSNITLYAYNATTGENLFSISLPQKFDLINSYGGASYAEVDFETIISNGTAYIATPTSVYAYKIPSGEKLWEYNTTMVIGDTHTGDFSPSMIGDIVLSGSLLYTIDNSLPWGDSKIVALNTDTGEVVWKFKILNDKFTLSADRFSGLMIVNNKLYASTWLGDIFAFEQGYEKPGIVNNETSLPDGMQNTAYVLTKNFPPYYPNYTFHVVNGQAPFSWTLSSGSLPDGINLANDADSYNGILYGTPTQSGNFNFTVRVTDSQGNYDEKPFSLRILPDAKELSVTLQNNGIYSGCESAGIESYYPDSNNGNANTISGLTGYGITEVYNARGLIKFNIFQHEGGLVPDDAIITGATLQYYKADSVLHDVSVYQILKNWSEMEATWNNATKNESWFSPGANETGIDRSGKILNFTTGYLFHGNWISQPGFYSLSIPSANVLGLQDNGWLLTQPTQTPLQIYSCSYSNDSLADNGALERSSLHVTYKRFNPDNHAPVVKMYANPSVILSGSSAVIDASGSYDPDKNDYIAGYDPFSSDYCLNYNPSTPLICNKTFSIPVHWIYICARCLPTPLQGYELWCSQNYNTACVTPPNESFDVVADFYDSYGVNATNSVTITVLNVSAITSPIIATTMLKDGQVGQAYSDFVYVQPAGSYTWSIVSGNLPQGLSLNSGTGEISGTPSVAGNYNFIIGAEGAQQTLSIEVLDANGLPQTCSDGTNYGACSSTQPKYCSSGNLIDNCAACGCGSGTCQSDGTCFYQPVSCQLTSATWSTGSALIGASVNLNIAGGNCNGKQINYTVWKNIPFWFDKKVFSSSSTSSTSWKAGLKQDSSYESGNYYFIATQSDNSTNSISSQSFGSDLSVIQCVDADGDGYNATGGLCGLVDCNDNDGVVYPGAFELCDGKDNNCNGNVDEGFNLGQSCNAGTGNCQRTGVLVCSADKFSSVCNAVPGNPASCNSLGFSCGQASDGCGGTLSCGTCSGNTPYCSSNLCVQCTSSSQCSGNSCSQIYTDSCSGKKLVDYNGNKLQDSLIVSNSCSNSCSLGSCTSCAVDCSASTPAASCVKNQCGAECDPSHSCSATACTQLSKCIGNDYYTYSDVTNSCLGDCTCEKNSCSVYSVSKNDPACTQCQHNSDCNSMNKIYCDSSNPKIVKNDTGICNSSYQCAVQTATVKDCSSLDNTYCSGTEIDDDNYTCSAGQCSKQTAAILECNDNLFCNGQETCSLGRCLAGSAPNCASADLTRIGYCNETEKKCDSILNDSDGDGVPDNLDKCPGNSPGVIVNVYGCPIPRADKFDIKPDFNISDILNLSDFTIGISRFGEIEYKNNNISLVPTNAGENYVDLDSNLNIIKNRIELNSSGIQSMNKPAVITLFNTGLTSPKILMDGNNCTDCSILSWTKISGNLVFSVLHFTTYEAVDNTCNMNGTCDAGEDCNNCQSDCGVCSYCGNGRIDSGEECDTLNITATCIGEGFDGGAISCDSSCSLNLSECYKNPSIPNGGNQNTGGGGGGSGGGSPQAVKCTPSWSCSEWSACRNEEQSRTCLDLRGCNTTINKPQLLQECTEPETSGNETGILQVGNVVQTLKLNWWLVVIAASGVLAILILILASFRIRKLILMIKAKRIVREGRKRKYSEKQIRDMFREKGWNENNIKKIMG